MRAWVVRILTSIALILVVDLGGGGGGLRPVQGVPQLSDFFSFLANPPWWKNNNDKSEEYDEDDLEPAASYHRPNSGSNNDLDYQHAGASVSSSVEVVDDDNDDHGASTALDAPSFSVPSDDYSSSSLTTSPWRARSDDGQVCFIDGTEFACKFSLFCWMTGGEGAGPCTGGALNTCCVPRGFTARASAAAAAAAVVSRSRRKYEYVHQPSNRLVEAPVRNDPVCGRPRMTLQKRIIGGSEANFGELPWQVHIRISGYQCGGVLLNHFFVATAAHCVHKAHIPLIQIHIGDLDTKNTGAFYEPMPSDTFAVEEIIIHPYFKFMSVQPDRFDVALLRLDRPVTYRANILPICLPSEPNADFEGMMGVVAGWGKTDTSYGKTGTNILNKVPVPVISNRDCKKWHALKNIRVALHDEMTCAGWMDGKMDACLGDSGSPLIVNDRGRWTLIGITSAGFGCAVDHQPGIYHRVAKTASWMSAMIW